MIYSKIISSGCFVGDKILTNDDLSKVLNTSDEWISSRTGIKERRIFDKSVPNYIIASKAVVGALQDISLNSERLDMIIVATMTNDYFFPSCASLVASELAIKKNIACFDINVACSGFIYAISIADNFIKSGKFEKIAVVGVDKNSAILDWQDRNTAVLFGDGAGCVILDKIVQKEGEWTGVKDCHISGNSINVNILKTNNIFTDDNFGIQMEGAELMKRAVQALSQNITETLHRNNLTTKDIKLFIPHQANYRIIAAIANKLDVSVDKFFVNLDKYGNTSAASVPIAMHEAISSGAVKEGDIILAEAVGAGLSWGSAIIKL